MDNLAIRLQEMIGCGMELVGKMESRIDYYRAEGSSENERNDLISELARMVQAGPMLRSQIDTLIREKLPLDEVSSATDLY